MPRRLPAYLLVLLLLVTLLGSARAEAPAPCFLHDGDVWVFHGDSITHADTYRRLVERVFRHFHPEAKVEFIQAGVWGSASSDLGTRLKAEGRAPTVVSLMIGMNNAINSGWVKGQPRATYLAGYRQDLIKFVQQNRAAGATVLLLSPTLTDDTCRHSYFRLDGGLEFLHDCQVAAQEVAAAEGALYIPVQEEFEAFQNTLDRYQKLRPDGVHPSSLGEYRIAQSLWERLSFPGPLGAGTAPRTLSPPPSRPPVTLSAVTRRLDPAAALTVHLTPLAADAALKLQMTCSVGAQRSTAEWVVNGPADFTLLAAGSVPALKPGAGTEAVVDLAAGEQRAVYVIDLCSVPVLHFTDNRLTGTIANAQAQTVAAWELQRQGGALLLTVDVTDTQIESSSEQVFQRDGINLFIDLRPTARLGDINFDADVFQAFVDFRSQPFVAAAVRAWMGAGFDRAATAGGEVTPTGYRLHVRLADPLGIHDPFALAQRDFIGFDLEVRDATKDAKGQMQVTATDWLAPLRYHDQYANTLPLIDLRDKVATQTITNVHVFPPPPVATPARGAH